MRRASLVVLLLAVAACDEEKPRQRAPEPAPPASVARFLGVDAGELEPGVDPPAPAGDFQAELDAFTTVDACAQQHAAVDPLVGDALEAIGYDTIVRDACRVLDAAKARDARRCERIDASALRERCAATVAEVAGSPDACPFAIAGRPELGRDPACLALAARDARLCAGVLDAEDRATCAAVAAHDAAPCTKLGSRAEQARCARDAKRWAGAIPAAQAGGGAELPARATAAADDKPLPLDLARGVVLLERIDGVHLVVGPMGRAAGSFVVPPPLAQGTLALELVVPADVRKASVERLELSLPQRPPLTLASPHTSSLSVKVTRLERTRGGAVELAVEGQPPDGPRIQASVTTFVRDVVKSSALLGTRGFGDAGILR